MIARISGELLEKGPNYVVVSAGGVGYQLFLSERSLSSVPVLGSSFDLYCRQIVRENEVSLYGFLTPGERKLFDLLITVSGLGPKIAMSVLGTLDESAIVTAVLQKDWKTLSRSQGVGAKLAEKICVELGDKFKEESLLGTIGRPRESAIDDVVEALVALGHRRSDAERAAIAARESSADQEASVLIPIALQFAIKK
ncbi:MAG: Holliday junction branch migration protein RuvA [Fimbriimonadales bacterium]